MFNPYVQGDVGEVLTASELRNNCNLTVLRNLNIPLNENICEIDMVAFSKFGLFVIENKNYKAKIEGTYSDYYWSVQHPNYKIEKLFNPIKQNTRHISVIRNILTDEGLYDLPIHNIVIFNDYLCKLILKDCDNSVFLLSDFVKMYNTFVSTEVSKDIIDRTYFLLKKYVR